MKTTYRLPNYEHTTNKVEYLRAWRSLGTELEKILKPLGYWLGGFDPDFMYYHHHRPCLYFPPDVAQRIVEQCAKDKP